MSAAPKRLEAVAQPAWQVHGPGLRTLDIGGPAFSSRLDPFLVVSMYDMSEPTFPPHPHAGFSVATYILPESPTGFVNQDTLGNLNAIEPGSLHWTTAGSGVLHEEQPAEPGLRALGFQVWVDHANARRLLPPAALHLAAPEVPARDSGGVTLRVVLGQAQGLRSPLEPPTAVRLLDLRLAPGAAFTETLDEGERAFVVVLGGAVSAEGSTATEGGVMLFSTHGSTLQLQAGPQGARCTVFAGQPLNQARAQQGPFVADDEQGLRAFVERYRQGAFGSLRPFAEQGVITPRPVRR